MLDIITVGHVVVDLIVSPRIVSPTVTVGGPATFVSLAANRLGAKVGVVSKVGKDFHEHLAWFRENCVDVSHLQVVENASTTRFVLTYGNGKRRLRIKNRAPQIMPEDIPASLHAKTIHVAPVANEISAEVVRSLRRKTPLLSIDPQGFLREFDETGKMSPKKLDDVGLLQHCDIFKSSTQEIKLITGHRELQASMKKIRNSGVEVVLVTMGMKGALAHFNEEFYHIPPCKPKTLTDPTGAGDVFIGAFLAEYVQAKDPVWCSCVGSAAASFVIEKAGAEQFGEKNEVYDRAADIYGKGIKPLPHNTVV